MDSDRGKVLYMWEGSEGHYFAMVQYWVGVGFQNVEREVDRDTYELWTL